MIKKIVDWHKSKSETRQTWHVAGGVLVISLLIFAGLNYSKVTHAAYAPIGYLEAVDSNGIISGWAYDQDTSSSIDVHLYVDGPAGTGTFIGATTASIPRTTLPFPGNHAFAFPLTNQFRDGNSHTVYAYAIDKTGDANTLLTDSPKSFTLASTTIGISNGTMEIGINPSCGGVINTIKLNGSANYVNNFDCGREIQAAFYDGNGSYDSCAGCTGSWDWDPVQGGDKHNFGSKIIDQSVTSSGIYVKTQPYEWNPDNKGGYPSNPVLTNTYIEQTITFVPGQTQAVKVHVKITNFGTDSHTNAVQELPAFYLNTLYNRMVYYSGSNPWNNATVSSQTLTGTATPNLFTSEYWTSLANSSNDGVTLYYPGQFPYSVGQSFTGSSGEYGTGANYFRTSFSRSILANSSFEGDLYLIPGNVDTARSIVYAIKNSNSAVDYAAPFGSVDAPINNQTISGTKTVSGWAFDNTAVSRVEVLVDDVLAGTATYGSNRADVAKVWPNAPSNVGFSYNLDTAGYSNGTHTVKVRVYDSNDIASVLPSKTVTISNTTPPPPPAKSHIILNPTSFNFSAVTGGLTPPGQTMQISNTGSVTLNWVRSTNQPWCQVTPASGSVAVSGNSNVSVTVSSPSNIGSFNCTITISDSNADNNPQLAQVTYTVMESSDTTQPITSITSPADNSTVTRGSTITIAAAASDNVGVASVEFYVNNSLACVVTDTPYACSWHVPNAPKKIYKLQTIAYDASGNSASSSIVTVTSK